MMARVANVVTVYLSCTQGVPGAPRRIACPVFEREPGADDDWPRARGVFPTRYPVLSAS